MSRIVKGKSGIFRADQEKVMLHFHETWFLMVELPRGVTQFYRISKDKVTNLKDPGFFFLKYVLNPPCLDFSGIAQQSLVML